MAVSNLFFHELDFYIQKIGCIVSRKGVSPKSVRNGKNTHKKFLQKSSCFACCYSHARLRANSLTSSCA